METFADIIGLWPNTAVFASDIGTTASNGRAMKRLNSVPAKYFLAIVQGAARREIAGVTYERLSMCAAHSAPGIDQSQHTEVSHG